MANRTFNRRQALEREVKDLYAKVTIGASGAPTLVAASSVGIASIARNSAGNYTLTLQDKYVALKFFQVTFLDDNTQDLKAQVHTDSIASAATIQFLTLTAASATDPQSGQTMLIKLELKNSTVI